MTKEIDKKQVITMFEQGYSIKDIIKKTGVEFYYLNFLLAEEGLKDFIVDINKIERMKQFYIDKHGLITARILSTKFNEHYDICRGFLMYYFPDFKEKKAKMVIDLYKKGLKYEQIGERLDISNVSIIKIVRQHKDSIKNDLKDLSSKKSNDFVINQLITNIEKIILSAEMVISSNSRSLSERINNLESKISEFKIIKNSLGV